MTITKHYYRMILASTFLVFCYFVTTTSEDRTSAEILRAKKLIENGNEKAAVNLLDSIVTFQPSNVAALTMRARALVQTKNYSAALNDCDKATALAPCQSESYMQRAFINDQCNRPSKALIDLNKVVELEPRKLEVYLKRAIVLEQLHRYEEALSDCNTAVILDPKNSSIYLKRAIVYLWLDDFGKVVDDCTTTITLNAKDTLAYWVRATAYHELNQYKKEVDDLTYLLEIDPSRTAAYEMRASAYYKLGLLYESVSDSQRIIKTHPNNRDMYRLCAKAVEELRMFKQAVVLRTKLIDFDKNSAFAWGDRAKVYEQLYEYGQAQKNWNMVKTLASRNELAYIQLNNPSVDFTNLCQRKKSLVHKTELSTVIPFCNQSCNHISIPVVLERRLSKFLLDTGNSYTEIWKGRKPRKEIKSSLTMKDRKANGKEYLFEILPGEDLKLGKIHWTNISMATSAGLSDHKELDGSVGGNVLEHFVVTVDYRNRRLLLDSSYHPHSKKRSIEMPMVIRNHKPYCIVKLDGGASCLALLDTGCCINIAPDSLLTKSLVKKFHYTDEIFGPWLGRLKCEKLIQGKIELTNLCVPLKTLHVFKAKEAPEIASTIILGNDFLGQFDAVTFDYLRGKVIFVQ